MKIKFLILCLNLLVIGSSTGILNAQDTLVLKDNSRIACKVLEVKMNSVDYKNWGSSDNTIFNIHKSLLYYIIYNNGATDTISKPDQLKSGAVSGKTDTAASGYDKGYNDGFNEYKDRAAINTCGVSSGVFGIIGIAAPIIFSASRIKPDMLNGDNSYFRSDDQNYKRGYLDGAKLRRKRYAWTGFGIGMGVRIALVGAIYVLAAF